MTSRSEDRGARQCSLPDQQSPKASKAVTLAKCPTAKADTSNEDLNEDLNGIFGSVVTELIFRYMRTDDTVAMDSFYRADAMLL